MYSGMHGAELAACVLRAQTGDSKAINALLREFRPQIYRYCLARLAQAEVAEDVTQDTCIALAEALPSYRERGKSFAAFVFGVASNKIKMALRGSARRPEDAYDRVPDRPSDAPGPAQVAEHDDQWRHLLSHLTILPERQREILLMRVVAGLSAQDVADALGMSAGAVRVAQHRAMTDLRLRIGNGVEGSGEAR